LILSGTKDKTDVSSAGVTTETRSSGWGIGPRAALMYNLGGKIFLGSEATYYLMYNTSKQEFTNQPSSSQKSSNITLQLPVSVFLIVKRK
jgi:hypothetical protein